MCFRCLALEDNRHHRDVNVLAILHAEVLAFVLVAILGLASDHHVHPVAPLWNLYLRDFEGELANFLAHAFTVLREDRVVQQRLTARDGVAAQLLLAEIVEQLLHRHVAVDHPPVPK